VGVLKLFDWPEFLYLWRINKFDWLVWVACFLTVLFAGVEIGIAVGVGEPAEGWAAAGWFGWLRCPCQSRAQLSVPC
jgi:hypothetical protein